MPTTIPILTAVPAVLNFAVKSFQTGYELKQVPQETGELLKTIESVRLDIVRAKENRIVWAKTSDSRDLVEWDRSIREVENALAGLEKIVEPARLDSQVNRGQIKAWTRLMWVIRDAHSRAANSDRLNVAHSRLLHYSSLAITQARQAQHQQEMIDEQAMGSPPPSYHDATKRAMCDRREYKQRKSRPGSIIAVNMPSTTTTRFPAPILDEYADSEVDDQEQPEPIPAVIDYVHSLPTIPTDEDEAQSQPQPAQTDIQSRPVSLISPAEMNLMPMLRHSEPDRVSSSTALEIPSFLRPMSLPPLIEPQALNLTGSARNLSRQGILSSSGERQFIHNEVMTPTHLDNQSPTRPGAGISSMPYRANSNALGPSHARSRAGSQPSEPEVSGSRPGRSGPSPSTETGYQEQLSRQPTRIPYSPDDYGTPERPTISTPAFPRYTAYSRNLNPVELAAPSAEIEAPLFPQSSTSDSIINTQKFFPGYRHPVNVSWQHTQINNSASSGVPPNGPASHPAAQPDRPVEKTSSSHDGGPQGEYLPYRKRRPFRRPSGHMQVQDSGLSNTTRRSG
jgi:hypothetical protein